MNSLLKELDKWSSNLPRAH